MTPAPTSPRRTDLLRGRLVGFERSYSCDECATEHVSWQRLRACPSCGAELTMATIRRAAVAAQ